MGIQIDPDAFANIIEIYQVAPNTIQVVTANRMTVRIIAMEKIRGPQGNYWAEYDVLVWSKIDGEPVEVWTSADFPWAMGETVEQCLRSAMGFVNEAGAAE